MSGCGSGSSTSPSTSSGANTPVGGAVTTPCPKQCTITSETVATQPANRTRTKIGVGEQVKLTFSLGNAAWNAPGAQLSSNNGTTVTLNAPERAASITVTATGSGCTSQITFQVIEPSGVRMIQHGTVIQHVQGQPSAGFLGDPYIQPSDVSFYNIQVRELDCAPTKSGYYTANTQTSHGANASYVSVQDPNSNGSPVQGTDHIWSGYIPSITGPPYQAGSLEFDIPWEYKVGSGGTPRDLHNSYPPADYHRKWIRDNQQRRNIGYQKSQ